jgi:hypothetical protein
MSIAKCHYCGNDAVVCCEQRIPGGEKLRTCPRAVCNKHAHLVDGTWKCFGHSLPPDDGSKRPWEG